MFRPGDKKIIENTKKSREWEKSHPDQDWRTGLTKEQIEELKKEG